MMRALVERHRGCLPLDTVERHLAGHHLDLHLRSGAVSAFTSTCRAATRRSGTRRVFTSASPCPACRISARGEVIERGGRLDRRSWHVRSRRRAGTRAPGGRASRRRTRRRSSRGCRSSSGRSSRGHAGVRDLEAAGRRAARDVVLESVTLDRWRADIPHALRKIGAERDRLGRRWDGACAPCRAAGEMLQRTR